MPPKASSKAPQHAAFLGSVEDVLIESAAALTEAQLIAAYALTRPKPAPPKPKRTQLSHPCPTKYTQKPTGSDSPTAKDSTLAVPPASPAGSAVSSAGREEEVMDVDSDGEWETHTRKKKNKATYSSKGKGKKKADAFECSAENCKRNPLCSNWLGQGVWEDTEEALEAYHNKIGLGENPVTLRKAGVPVGLRNLGATCYMNSFVQVWFQDLLFRQAIYNSRPPATVNAEDSPLFHLQVLFASLQRSAQSVYDPEPLVKSLRLNMAEQQDAQEFGKLFLDKLSRDAKKSQPSSSSSAPNSSTSTSTSSSITDRFEGLRTYGTECDECENRSERQEAFVELDIALKPNCSLENQLKSSLTDEQLSGSNQYHCDNCDCKRDATRYARIDTLPAVLHFSITRFQYDFDAERRVKSEHKIDYPLRLDLAKLLDLKNGPVWYELKGVLEHRGTEAESGHYVAKVNDAESGKWFLCNDELVTPIDDINDAGDDDDDEPVQPLPKRSSSRKAVTKDSDGAVRLHSREAYMLVYTAASTEPPAPVDAPEPPASALEQVEVTDVAKKNELEEWEQKAEAARAQFDLEREKRRLVYTQFELGQDESEGVLVSQASLAEWIAEPLAKAKKEKKEEKEIDLTGSDDPPTADKADNGPEKDDSPPLDPTMDVVEEKARSTTPTLASSSSHDSPPAEPSSAPQMTMSNEAIVCKHNLAALNKCGEMKLISKRSVAALESLGHSIAPELRFPRDLCRECVWSIVAEQTYKRTHRENVNAFEEVEFEDDIDVDPSFVSARWLRDWKKPMPSMHVSGTLTDPNPTDDEFETDVYCHHERLQPKESLRKSINPAAAALLEAFFPGWKRCELTVPCSQCAAAAERAEVSAKMSQELKAKERKVLNNLGDSQTTIGGLPVMRAMDMFIVPRAWARQWNAWSHTKIDHVDKQRPGDLDNSPLLCEHNKIAIDVHEEVDRPRQLALTTAKGWEFLQVHYAAGPEIKIWADEQKQTITKPDVCYDCLEKRRKNFSTTKLSIRQLTKDDFTADGYRKQISNASSDQGSEHSKSPSTERGSMDFNLTSSSLPPRRVSTRAGARQQLAQKLKSIEMRKGDNVLELKLKINEILSAAPPIYQRLWFNEYELENEQTVDELGMGEGSVVELYVAQEGDPEFKSTKKSKAEKRKREEGFGGTGLAGDWGNDEAQVLSSIAPSEAPEVEPPKRDEDQMDVDSTEHTRTPPAESPFSDSPTVKKAKTVYHSETKQSAKKSGLVAGTGLFDMNNLTQVNSQSKRAATASTTGRSPSLEKKNSVFRPARTQSPTTPRPAAPARSQRSSSSSSRLPPPDVDLTEEGGTDEEDEELKRAIALSQLESAGETEEQQIARALAASTQGMARPEGSSGGNAVASGSGQKACPRCTLLNKASDVLCDACDMVL